MEILKFSHKPFVVQVVKLTEENVREVAAWTGGEIYASDMMPERSGITLPTYGRVDNSSRSNFATSGDDIIRDFNGRFRVLLPGEIQESYDAVMPSVPEEGIEIEEIVVPEVLTQEKE